MAAWSRYTVAFAALALSMGACSDGCVEPLPDGFDRDARVENAASLRLTASGLGFLAENLGVLAASLLGSEDGSLGFPVNEVSGQFDFVVTDIDYTLCPGGPIDSPPTCQVEIDLGGLEFDIVPEAPHHLVATGVLPVLLRDLPMETDVGDGNITISGNRVCPDEGPTFALLDTTVRVSLETDADATHARYGYTRMRIEEIAFDEDQITDQLALCGGIVIDILDADLVRGLVVDLIAPGLLDTVRVSVEELLCQKPTETSPCPTGTNDIDGTCRYGTDAESDCVSIVLGLDGHTDLASLLASISPGTPGAIDFLVAAGGPGQRADGLGTFGDLDPVLGGATFGMFGGVLPRPTSGCVPLSTMEPPIGLPIPDELRLNGVAGWPQGFPRPDSTGPDLGLALSEELTNYALSNLYNSGLLCIGLGPDTLGSLVSSGTLALFAPSFKDLALQRESTPVAIVLRPTAPPVVTFGDGTDLATDPGLRVEIPGLAFDFYVWSLDRYLRVFSAKYDLDMPANMDITPEGLVFLFGETELSNGVVENAELLAEDPQVIADSLGSLIAGQVGAILEGAIPPIDVGGLLSSFGIGLQFPPSQPGAGSAGLRRLVKDDRVFLGMFAGLDTVAVEPLVVEADVLSVEIDPDGMRGATMEVGSSGNGPVVVVEVTGDTANVEHQVQVDAGPWRPFEPALAGDRAGAAIVRVRDEALRLEGVHAVRVRSRRVGEPYALSDLVQLDVRIDITPPDIFIDDIGGELALDAFDVVTDREALVARVAYDHAEAGPWVGVDDVGDFVRGSGGARAVTLQVRDEAGHVASVTVPLGEATSEIVRGAARAESCGCSLPGVARPVGGMAAIALLLATLVAIRRRGR